MLLHSLWIHILGFPVWSSIQFASSSVEGKGNHFETCVWYLTLCSRSRETIWRNQVFVRYRDSILRLWIPLIVVIEKMLLELEYVLPNREVKYHRSRKDHAKLMLCKICWSTLIYSVFRCCIHTYVDLQTVVTYGELTNMKSLSF